MQKLVWNAYFWLVFLLFTLAGLVVLPFYLLFDSLITGRSLPSALRRAIRIYGWVLTRLVPFAAPVETDYLCKELPPVSIFVANHNSAIDPYLFGTIPVENAFVTSWPFRIPVYGFFMRLAGYVDARDGWGEVRNRCRKLLDGGSSVTIWPEGHRSRDMQLGRFKNGAFSLAVETGHPIVPVCILGSGKVLPPGAMWMNPRRVRLLVLPPCYPEKLEDEAGAVRELKLRVREAVRDRLEKEGHFARGTV